MANNIQYAYGYLFAGYNLTAFFVVYFFLLESSGRTLEEVDAMYLLHVTPLKSAKYEFDEEMKKTLGRDINMDVMHLRRHRRGFTKSKEGA
jgi:SP family sugar:H+ symporter-like MFS transporter